MYNMYVYIYIETHKRSLNICFCMTRNETRCRSTTVNGRTQPMDGGAGYDSMVLEDLPT